MNMSDTATSREMKSISTPNLHIKSTECSQTRQAESSSEKRNDGQDFKKRRTEQDGRHTVQLVSCSPAHTVLSSSDESIQCPALINIDAGDTRVGRDSSCCVVVLSAPGVSRLHAVISVDGDSVTVLDRSHNGTFVNGRLIGRDFCAILREGDVVSFVNPMLPEVKRLSYTLRVSQSLLAGGPHEASPCRGVSANDNQCSFLKRYTLGASIGRGGSAVVRLGVDTSTGTSVAVKVVDKTKLHSNTNVVSLHAEMRILRGICHPNIVRLLDAHESPSMDALVMEYIPGGDLLDYVLRRGGAPLQEREAKQMFTQLVAAVAWIHDRGLLHCDIKPENVLVGTSIHAFTAAPAEAGKCYPPEAATGDTEQRKSPSPKEVHLKLIDFGSAMPFSKPQPEASDGTTKCPDTEAASQQLSMACSLGTPRYASPEQRFNSGCLSGQSGAQLTPAVDVWGLGVVLHLLCLGALPTVSASGKKVTCGRHHPGVSNECMQLIRSMLDIDVAKRITLRDICRLPWFNGTAVPSECIEVSLHLESLASLAPNDHASQDSKLT